MRVLIVEDHADLARELTEQMSRGGFRSDRVGTLAEARDIVGVRGYCVALIDRRLPDGDGIAFIPELRRTLPEVSILMLTALDETRELVASLDAGADDYLTKPFEPDELMARIRTSLRRAKRGATAAVTLGRLSFDPRSREFAVGDKPIVLQRREALLLETLLRRVRRVVMREMIADEVWGEKEDLSAHNLNALVSQLRARLKRLDAEVEIHPARGLGYFIAEDRP
jgi:two-component system, OmpR family, response regulator